MEILKLLNFFVIIVFFKRFYNYLTNVLTY